MKRIAWILLPVVAAAADFSSFRGKHSCPAIGNSHQCARSIEAALNVPYVSRSGGSKLQVTLLDGRAFTLEDGNAEQGGELYSAVEIVARGRFVVLHRQFWEGGSYSLLDRGTGRVTKLAGYPEFSPDLRWVAIARADVGAGYSANALQIHRHSDGVLSLSFDAKPDRWGPERVVWKSPTQLSYLRATSECHIEKKQPCDTATLTLGTGGWH